MPILGCLNIEAINLLGPAGTRHPPSISNTLAMPSKKRIIAAIKHQAGSNDTFGGRARLGHKLRTGTSGNIESVDIFQTIAERGIEVRENSFPNVKRKSVIPLVVKRAQIVCLVIKTTETDRNRPVHEPRFGSHDLGVFSLEPTLQPDPEPTP